MCQDACKMASAYSPSFHPPLSSISINMSNLLNQNGVGEIILSITDENGEKGTHIFSAKLATVCTNV